MDTETALQFLRDHQPLADDFSESGEELSEADSIMINEVLIYFHENYDERCVPLILNCFGNGDGYGVYLYALRAISIYPANVVIPALAKSLTNKSGGVRWWSSQIAATYGQTDSCLIAPLLSYLQEDGNDERMYCVYALEPLWNNDVENALIKQLEREKNPTVAQCIEELLGSKRK
jgi:hypothetical protein